MDTHELAWAAGFFDGEGNVGAFDRRNQHQAFPIPRLIVQAAQSDPQVLVRFKDALLGLGRVSGPFPRRSEKHAPYWRYAGEGYEYTQAIMAILWKYLSPVKRQQFYRALHKYRVASHPLACTKDPGHRLGIDKRGRPLCHGCRSKAALQRWVTRRERESHE